MSKTSETSLAVQEATMYWKRFAASVTAFANRFREDQFLRTEVTIVFLQIAFALVLLAVVWAGFNSVHQDVTNALIARILEAQKAHASLDTSAMSDVLRAVQEVQTKSLLAVVATIILTTALFGYALARLALIPTRNALTSQKQFIGNIAHELRTPLSIIKTNTEVALFDTNLRSDFRDIFESNVEELDRISQIINNLLSLSVFVRPERIEFENVDLGTVVESALADSAPLAKRKNQTVMIKKAEYRLVWGNATGLGQIAMNLLKNAINYTHEGGEIHLTIEPDYRGSIVFSVKDTGLGIARKDLFRIFEPFYRAEQSRSRQRGSAGLGLTIVSELVKLHRGKISIQSAVGRGTTVTVLLPCGKNDLEKEPEVKEKEKKQAKNDMGEIAVDFSS